MQVLRWLLRLQGGGAKVLLVDKSNALGGEAAGTAISIAVKRKTDTRSINVDELRETLRKNGAFIG